MLFTPNTFLIALLSFSPLAQALPVALHADSQKLEPKAISYSVVDVDGGASTPSAKVTTKIVTQETTETVDATTVVSTVVVTAKGTVRTKVQTVVVTEVAVPAITIPPPKRTSSSSAFQPSQTQPFGISTNVSYSNLTARGYRRVPYTTVPTTSYPTPIAESNIQSQAESSIDKSPQLPTATPDATVEISNFTKTLGSVKRSSLHPPKQSATWNSTVTTLVDRFYNSSTVARPMKRSSNSTASFQFANGASSITRQPQSQNLTASPTVPEERKRSFVLSTERSSVKPTGISDPMKRSNWTLSSKSVGR